MFRVIIRYSVLSRIGLYISENMDCNSEFQLYLVINIVIEEWLNRTLDCFLHVQYYCIYV